MATFLSNADVCETEEVSFFTSGAYTRGSFSSGWGTLTTPDTEGLGIVYQDVLNRFNIPFDSAGGLPAGGTLPGVDIKRMDAIDAVRLSMAESLVAGEWWEMYEDNEGGVYFQLVFGAASKTVDLDIRLCIPSSSKDNQVDMVVVHGYDPPPEVYAGPFRDVVPVGLGPINPASLTGSEPLFTVAPSELVNSCHSTVLRRQAVKSYLDPLVDSSVFGTQVPNPFYDVTAYEDILKWAVRIQGLDDTPSEAAAINYSFQKTTCWYFEPGFPHFSKKTELTDEDVGCTTGLQQGDQIAYYTGSFDYDGIITTDKYGDAWPLVIRPVKLLYTGYKVNNIYSWGVTSQGFTHYVFVNPVKELLQLSEGSQWTYYNPGVNKFRISMFYQPEIDTDTWDYVLDVAQGGEGEVRLQVSDGQALVFTREGSFTGYQGGSAKGFLPGPGSLGYYVTDLWLGLELERPCVEITTKDGSAALDHLAKLHVEYAPIIAKDLPAPIAYKYDGDLVLLGPDEQAEGKEDIDPTTCQSFDDTPLQLMQDRMLGNTLEVTLPFCQDAAACAMVAETIFDYQNYTGAQTVTLTCGPDSEPELGAAVAGYDANLRIESINYSFSDGSAYTIEVTLGPVFSNIGSWQNGAWMRKRENVTRPAFITWSAGDGLNYRVMVQGIGEFNAINVARDSESLWRVGERVTVEIYNVPIEE